MASHPDPLTQNNESDVPMNDSSSLHRRPSKKSGSGFSLWSRKSLKRSNTAQSVSPVDVVSSSNDDSHTTPHNAFQRQLSFQGSLSSDIRNAMAPTAGEPPTWDSVLPAAVKVYYNIHNPLGPKWYKNHHLIPPSQSKPSMRPPTFFSPSFPPISTSSTQDHPIDSDPPSRSPLATPASSQTRVGEGVKPRSRKTSQTAPDTVDLLDVTDPWGTNWHHESPYDVGQTSTSALDVDGHGKRIRRASMTAAQNSLTKSMTPSPLSQSTSAVHLASLGQPSLPPSSTISQTIQLPRKLSKRKPGIDGLFRPLTKDDDRKAVSAPPTPVERIRLADSPPPELGSFPKRMSVAPPVHTHPPFVPSSFQTIPKKEKRTSVLKSIAKKFSLLAKSPSDESDRREYSWLHVNPEEARMSMRQSLQPPAPQSRQSSPEKSEGVKRVPPPPVESPEPVTPPKRDTMKTKKRRTSSVSIEAPFLLGNLTVANPDSPESDKEAPDQPSSPLPIAKPIPLHFTSAPAVLSSANDQPEPPQPSPSPSFAYQTYAAYEKPLPIPVPSTTANTPQASVKDISPAEAEEPSGEERQNVPRRNKTVSSTATRDTVKLAKSDFTAIPAVDEETDKSVLTNQAIVDGSTIGSTLSPEALPTLEVEKDKSTNVPAVSPSLPPIPVTTPLTQIVALRHSTSELSRRSTTPEFPSKAPELPRISTLRDSNATTQQAYLTPIALSPEEITAQDRINSYLHNTDSPYSASSVLANPPTPYSHHSPILLSPEPDLPPLPPAKPPKEKGLSDEALPSQATRQTETFKLVRNLSANIFASTETIPVAGQQWEVVESNDHHKGKHRSSSKKDSRDRESRRESRAEESGQPKVDYSADNEGSRSRTNRHSKQASQQQEVSTIPMPKVASSRHSPSQHEDDYRRRVDQYEPLRYRDDQRRHTKHRSDDDYRRREERRLEEERRYEEQRRYEEERREKERERRKREREREKERQRERERERERLEKEKELERHRELERERDRLERERLERERLERLEKEREKLERERLELELEKERLKREKEKERERRREEEKERERRREEERLNRENEKERERRREEDKRRREEEKRREREEREVQSRAHRKRQDRKDDSRKLRKTDNRRSEVPRESYISYTQQPIQPSSSSSSSDARLVERRPSMSTSTRPTSELPSAADLNALRAKEAWEMERLWKARSMYGAEWNNGAVAAQSMLSFTDDPSAASQAIAYGSSHTAFMVQTPFQPPGSSIYHSMPSKPPPIIYGSPASIPSLPDSSYDPYDRNNLARQHPVQRGFINGSPSHSLLGTSPLSRSALLNNPLPEPPRESTYQPAPLPPLKPSNRSSDPWVKYTSVTTAH